MANALYCPKKSKERRVHLDFIRKREIVPHNIDVIKEGKGIIVYMHCSKCCYLAVVGQLVCFHDSESYAGRGFYTPGRFYQAGKVKEEGTD